MKGRDEIKMKVKIINETLDDDYSSSNFEMKRGIDTTENIFYVGQRFSSLDGLEGLKSKYEDDNFCELWKKDVRTLAAAQKRVPKRIAIANLALYYYSLLLSCKFGGEPKKRNIRVRKTKSSRQGCPFEVYLALALDGQALEFTRITEGHNHQLSKELYDHLPRQRAFECKLGVLHAIKLRANTKLLQQNVLQTTGKRVTLKDLRI